MDGLAYLQEHPVPLAKLLGIEFVSATPELLIAQVRVCEESVRFQQFFTAAR